MEVGDGMLYASSVVDGVVHQLGGSTLEWACQQIGTSSTKSTTKCPEGNAVVTGPGTEEVAEHYDHIIHTVPPFYHHYDYSNGNDDDINNINNINRDPENCLRSCYQ